MSDIPTLQWLSDWANVGVIAALVASLIAGGASILLSKKLGMAKDQQYSGEKQASDEKIATANAEAAKANEGLGKSNQEIARLTNEAEQAKTERAEADRQIAIAKADAARAKEGTANAEAVSAKASVEVARLQVVVANAEQKRAEAEKALLEVQQRITPRHFSLEEESRLVAALSASPVKELVAIECVLGDAEGFAFASQIDGILKAAGWPTSGVSQGVFAPNNPVGFGIQVHGAETVPAHARDLQDAFRRAGIGTLQLLPTPTLPEGTVQLLVGNKP